MEIILVISTVTVVATLIGVVEGVYVPWECPVSWSTSDGIQAFNCSENTLFNRQMEFIVRNRTSWLELSGITARQLSSGYLECNSTDNRRLRFSSSSSQQPAQINLCPDLYSGFSYGQYFRTSVTISPTDKLRVNIEFGSPYTPDCIHNENARHMDTVQTTSVPPNNGAQRHINCKLILWDNIDLSQDGEVSLVTTVDTTEHQQPPYCIFYWSKANKGVQALQVGSEIYCKPVLNDYIDYSYELRWLSQTSDLLVGFSFRIILGSGYQNVSRLAWFEVNDFIRRYSLIVGPATNNSSRILINGVARGERVDVIIGGVVTTEVTLSVDQVAPKQNETTVWFPEIEIYVFNDVDNTSSSLHPICAVHSFTILALIIVITSSIITVSAAVCICILTQKTGSIKRLCRTLTPASQESRLEALPTTPAPLANEVAFVESTDGSLYQRISSCYSTMSRGATLAHAAPRFRQGNIQNTVKLYENLASAGADSATHYTELQVSHDYLEVLPDS